MLRLRSSVLAHLLSSPSATYPISLLHRLLSTTSTVSPIPANPAAFAVEEYLVGTCGLTRAQALKASPKLSHLKSPTKPDAVLAFLAGLSLSGADVAALVAKDPKFLCADVARTLSPVVAGLSSHGLSQTEVARLLSLGHSIYRCRSTVSKLTYYMSLFGSMENVVRFLNQGSTLLRCSIEKVKPNVAFLQECGLRDCDISKLCLSTPRLLSANLERVHAAVACAEGLGVPRGSARFRYMLRAVTLLSEEKIAAKLESLKNIFGWSDAEVRVAVCKAPCLLTMSKDSLESKSEFLISEVGLEPAYIARLPVTLSLSLEGRLRPRYYVLKFLKENGLLDPTRNYYGALVMKENLFVEKFICPHKESAPHLAEDYTAACRGEVPARFRFT